MGRVRERKFYRESASAEEFPEKTFKRIFLSFLFLYFHRRKEYFSKWMSCAHLKFRFIFIFIYIFYPIAVRFTFVFCLRVNVWFRIIITNVIILNVTFYLLHYVHVKISFPIVDVYIFSIYSHTMKKIIKRNFLVFLSPRKSAIIAVYSFTSNLLIINKWCELLFSIRFCYLRLIIVIMELWSDICFLCLIRAATTWNNIVY